MKKNYVTICKFYQLLGNSRHECEYNCLDTVINTRDSHQNYVLCNILFLHLSRDIVEYIQQTYVTCLFFKDTKLL